VQTALLAARELETKGVHAAVIDARFVKPLDAALIAEWATKTGAIVTVEENARMGGFGSAVLELLSDRGLAIKTRNVALPDRFIEHGPQAELRKLVGIDAEGVVRAVTELLRRQ
jgi:1-deoxy-D-xylulose-5-phosphate synthase